MWPLAASRNAANRAGADAISIRCVTRTRRTPLRRSAVRPLTAGICCRVALPCITGCAASESRPVPQVGKAQKGQEKSRNSGWESQKTRVGWFKLTGNSRRQHGSTGRRLPSRDLRSQKARLPVPAVSVNVTRLGQLVTALVWPFRPERVTPPQRLGRADIGPPGFEPPNPATERVGRDPGMPDSIP